MNGECIIYVTHEHVLLNVNKVYFHISTIYLRKYEIPSVTKIPIIHPATNRPTEQPINTAKRTKHLIESVI